jgi:hypothetical protein
MPVAERAGLEQPWAMRTRWAAVCVGCASTLVGHGASFGWDDFGHMEVARVAYQQLKPSAKKRATELPLADKTMVGELDPNACLKEGLDLA